MIEPQLLVQIKKKKKTKNLKTYRKYSIAILKEYWKKQIYKKKKWRKSQVTLQILVVKFSWHLDVDW